MRHGSFKMVFKIHIQNGDDPLLALRDVWRPRVRTFKIPKILSGIFKILQVRFGVARKAIQYSTFDYFRPRPRGARPYMAMCGHVWPIHGQCVASTQLQMAASQKSNEFVWFLRGRDPLPPPHLPQGWGLMLMTVAGRRNLKECRN